MGKQQERKQQQVLQRQKEEEALSKKPKVRMVFGSDQYYQTTDPSTSLVPLYQKNVEYDIEPQYVARWLKRGGQIVGKDGQVEQTIVEPVAPVAPVAPVIPVAPPADDTTSEDQPPAGDHTDDQTQPDQV